MKKKILMLTSIYPGKDINETFTPIVHYFTREWGKMNCEVIVIHNLAYYHSFFYFIASFFSKLIAAFTGTNIPNSRLTKVYKYNLEGVKVIRIPIFKFLPRFRFAQKTILKQEEKIFKELAQYNYIPDVIVGHWENPQLELISLLKKRYPNSLSSLVFHHKADFLINLYKNDTKEILSNIDVFGFRSAPIRESFKQFGININNSFMCYSGIPESFTQEKIIKKFNNNLFSFLFVGVLIKRKYPSQIIDALEIVYKDEEFKLDYIGEGFESRKIESKIKRKLFLQNVTLNGRIPREQVWVKMKESDCFIMISKNEAYGLVYLEAMAAGCITIAARDEGFDGVIKHGENGFLCEAGNVEELALLIERINKMNIEKKQEISNNAILTATKLTNFRAAESYLRNLEK
jgi:glycosyltransferase involved in cell wall biosynthesis